MSGLFSATIKAYSSPSGKRSKAIFLGAVQADHLDEALRANDSSKLDKWLTDKLGDEVLEDVSLRQSTSGHITVDSIGYNQYNTVSQNSKKTEVCLYYSLHNCDYADLQGCKVEFRPLDILH